MALEIRIFGIPVSVHASFLITGLGLWLVFGGWEVGASALPIAILISFQSFLCHEMGHAAVGSAFGLKPRVHLLALRSVTEYRAARPLSPGRGMLVSFMGPFVGIVIGAPALFASPFIPENNPLLRFTFEYFVGVNLGWALLSLIPVLPLDGGLMMASFFQLFSKEKGVRWARYGSLVVLAALGALAVVGQWPILLLALAFPAIANVRAIRAEKALLASGAVPVRSLEDVASLAYRALERGDARTVQQCATILHRNAADDAAKDEALHLLAWGKLLAEEPGAAREVLDKLSGERDADPALEGAIQLALGRAQQAVELFERALELGPSSFIEKRYPEAVEAAGAWDRAKDFLDAHPDVVSASTVQRIQSGAYQAGRMDVAFLVGEGLFAQTAEPIVAFNVACSLARLGRAEEALSWIEKARLAGFGDLGLLDDDEDLATVRELPGWTALRSRFG